MTIERAERTARRFIEDTEFYAGIWNDVQELAEEFLKLKEEMERIKDDLQYWKGTAQHFAQP